MEQIKKRISDFFELITSERFFFYYIAFVMIALPVTEIFDELHSMIFASQPIIVEMAGYFGIFIFAVHFLKHQGIKYYLSDLLYFLLFVFAVLSAVFSHNKYDTFHGFYYDEWLFNFVGYFSLMLAGTMIQDKQLRKKLINIFILVTVIQVSFGVLQTFGISLRECYFDTEIIMSAKRSYGLIQHSNWFGGLTVLLFACTSGAFLYTQNKVMRNACYIISVICFYTLISAEARLAWVGVFGYLLFLAVSIIVMKRKGLEKEKLMSIIKRLLVLLLGMAVVTVIAIVFFGRIIERVQQTKTEMSGDGFIHMGREGMGSGRVYIWKQGLKSVPDHWAFGIGLDNYRDVFLSDSEFDGMFTQGKGHNEYIHYLVTQGVFQLITYLTLLIHTAVTGVKNVIKNDDNEERYLNWILMGMFFGYTAQAFFNSSVVNVVPYFWITVGMLLTKKNQRPLGSSKKNRESAAAKH